MMPAQVNSVVQRKFTPLRKLSPHLLAHTRLRRDYLAVASMLDMLALVCIKNCGQKEDMSTSTKYTNLRIKMRCGELLQWEKRQQHRPLARLRK